MRDLTEMIKRNLLRLSYSDEKGYSGPFDHSTVDMSMNSVFKAHSLSSLLQPVVIACPCKGFIECENHNFKFDEAQTFIIRKPESISMCVFARSSTLEINSIETNFNEFLEMEESL